MNKFDDWFHFVLGHILIDWYDLDESCACACRACMRICLINDLNKWSIYARWIVVPKTNVNFENFNLKLPLWRNKNIDLPWYYLESDQIFYKTFWKMAQQRETITLNNFFANSLDSNTNWRCNIERLKPK